MKTGGFLILLAGWFLILAALVLLPDGMARNAFIVAGLGVEAVGLFLAVKSHMRPAERR